MNGKNETFNKHQPPSKNIKDWIHKKRERKPPEKILLLSPSIFLRCFQVNTVAWKWICCSNESSRITWFKSTRRVACWLSCRGCRSGLIKELCQLEFHSVSQPYLPWQHKRQVSMPHCRLYLIQKLLTFGLECVWRLFSVRYWSLHSSIMPHVQVSLEVLTTLFECSYPITIRFVIIWLSLPLCT